MHGSRRSVVAVTLLAASCLAGRPAQAAKIDMELAAPAANHIPVPHMESAVERAVANGVASVMARVLADGNSFGLAFPPRVTRKQIGTKEVPARRVTYKHDIFKHEYATVEQLVPEMSAGRPTGGFVRAKVSVLVKSTKVGTEERQHLVHDPNGTETMKVAEYGPGGPDVYEAYLPGLNGMALYVLAKSGHKDHEATGRLAAAIAEKLSEFGISDLTFDVAWLAAGFCALGSDSLHDDLARELVGKLIDGQIREKGDPKGLWGPVCIHYAYFAKLFETQAILQNELEVKLPKMLEQANPQQQAGLVKQGQELRKVLSAFQRAYRTTSSVGTRMMDVTKPWQIADTSIIPGLPLYIYNRVVADVESTAVAAFALAEARRNGLLPAETPRVAIRGKKVHPAEKADVALKLAADKLAGSIHEDGGFGGLVLQAINTGFDKSKLPLVGVPYKGEVPPLLDVESAATNVSGQAALEFLAAAAPEAMKSHEEVRAKARARAAAVAARWYEESAKGLKGRWTNVYEGLTVSKAALKASEKLPYPEYTPTPVDKLPWGGMSATFEIVPCFMGLIDRQEGTKPLADDLCRQLAYRLVGQQDSSGQWVGARGDIASSATDALAIADVAKSWHRALDLDRDIGIGDPIKFQTMLRFGWAVDRDHWLQGEVYPTLASLVFLVQLLDGPANVDGVTLVPEVKPEGDAEPAPISSSDAASKAERASMARSELYDAVLASMKYTAADVPVASATKDAAKPEADAAPAPETDENGEELGKVDDLLIKP